MKLVFQLKLHICNIHHTFSTKAIKHIGSNGMEWKQKRRKTFFFFIGKKGQTDISYIEINMNICRNITVIFAKYCTDTMI